MLENYQGELVTCALLLAGLEEAQVATLGGRPSSILFLILKI